jgi:hypothetical protein
MIWEYSNLKDKDEKILWQEGYCYSPSSPGGTLAPTSAATHIPSSPCRRRRVPLARATQAAAGRSCPLRPRQPSSPTCYAPLPCGALPRGGWSPRYQQSLLACSSRPWLVVGGWLLVLAEFLRLRKVSPGRSGRGASCRPGPARCASTMGKALCSLSVALRRW